MMPETTVLIPTYNCGKFIKATLESILSQTYQDYEILIIDDGSTDNTFETLNMFSDQRIIYLKNDKNLGIVKSLNKGVKKARGKFIARMDADDLMVGNRLYDQIAFLKKEPAYGIVGSWYRITDEKGNLLQSLKTQESHDCIKLGLLFRNQFAHPSITMRTELVKQLKYKEDFIYTEDYDLWCRMAQVTKLANLPSYHLLYRWHSNNTCNKRQNELKRNVVKLLSRELNRYHIDHGKEELIMHSALCFGYGKKYFNSDQKLMKLNLWLDKIFSSKMIIDKFNTIGLENFRNELFENLIR